MTSELKNVRNMTAQQAYECRVSEIKQLLAQVEEKINAKCDQFEAEKNLHWGHVGDMTYIAEQLQAILS